MRHDCGVGPEDLGPYLLGQLPSGEQARVLAVLDDCPGCAAEVAELRPTVAALAVGRPLPADLPSLPAAAFNRVLDTVERQAPGGPPSQLADRRPPAGAYRRAVFAVAAAVVAVAFGLGGFLVGAHRQPAAGETIRLSSPAGPSARVVLAERSWGTEITLQVRGLDPSVTYGAWLARPNGQRVSAGSFRPDPQGAASLQLAAALPRADSGALGVTALGAADVLSTTLQR